MRSDRRLVASRGTEISFPTLNVSQILLNDPSELWPIWWNMHEEMWLMAGFV